MAITLISVLFVLAGFAMLATGFCRVFSKDNPDGRALRKSGHALLGGGYLFSRWKRMLMKKMQLQKQEEQFYRALYVNENPQQCRLVRECRQGTMVFSFLIGFGVLLLALTFSGVFTDVKVESFERPENGSRVYRLRAEYEEQNYDMELTVNERKLTEDEVRAAWEKAKESLPKLMLASNVSAEEVTEPLSFPKKLPGTTIELVWMPSDYKLVDYEGKVYPANASPEGNIVIVSVQVKYGSFVEFLDIPIRIVRGEQKTDVGELLAEELQQIEAARTHDSTMDLPTDMGDSPITFYKKKSKTPWLFFVLFLLLLIGLFALWESEEKRLKKGREDQLLRDYPDLVSKITLLLQAGLTLRSAWDRITDDYLSASNLQTVYVYEEMSNIRNKMNAGVPEENAYEEFGRNCGNIRYLRLSSVLVQNLKKGTGGLVPLLRKEAAEAFAERKEHVKQSGEEAGTKLLIPMAGILILILAIIMIPAFLSF